MRVYSALYDDFCHAQEFFPGVETLTISSIAFAKKPGLLILHGGSDISPKMYKEVNVASHAGNTPSARDIREAAILEHWLKNKWPVFGICRGMQLITACLGGKLIQHVNNHTGGGHEMVTDDGEQLQVNSAHHQMCDVTNIEGAKIVGWTPKKLSDVYIGGSAPEKEPEAVYFQKHNAFAVQWHPEWMSPKRKEVSWVFEQLSSKLNLE